jgi:hypothetical protein
MLLYFILNFLLWKILNRVRNINCTQTVTRNWFFLDSDIDSQWFEAAVFRFIYEKYCAGCNGTDHYPRCRNFGSCKSLKEYVKHISWRRKQEQLSKLVTHYCIPHGLYSSCLYTMDWSPSKYILKNYLKVSICSVALVRIDVSEECISSIITVERIRKR